MASKPLNIPLSRVGSSGDGSRGVVSVRVLSGGDAGRARIYGGGSASLPHDFEQGDGRRVNGWPKKPCFEGRKGFDLLKE